MIKCKLCGQYFNIITNTHLSSVHNYTIKKYIKKFGPRGVGFISPNLLPENDPRYITWRESLKKRPEPWNKGHTKETHPSVLRVSKTFKQRKIDNFASWRREAIEKGLIKKDYPALQKSDDLAELIGVFLGDGHIYKFPRTELLKIFSHSDNSGFIQRYVNIIEKVFDKKPTIRKRKSSNCTEISFYQKHISRRLGVPIGSKKDIKIDIPQWIWRNKDYLIRYLRGLYEAEGTFCVHKPTYTYKLIFVNRNESLLNNVYLALQKLEFHPHRSEYKIQISRKAEVYCCKDLIGFRKY